MIKDPTTGRFVKGTGSHLTEEHKRKISDAQLNEKNHAWKADEVKYQALHQWIRKNKPQPEGCERCGVKRHLECANISGEYKRDVNDFIYVCVPCHWLMDNKRGFIGRKHKDESKEKMRLAKIGKKQSEERKRKQSEIVKAIWERRRQGFYPHLSGYK